MYSSYSLGCLKCTTLTTMVVTPVSRTGSTGPIVVTPVSCTGSIGPVVLTCFVYQKYRFRMLVWRPATLAEGFRGFSQSPLANAGTLTRIGKRPLPSTSFPVHYSLTNMSFHSIYFELLTVSFKEPQINEKADRDNLSSVCQSFSFIEAFLNALQSQ